MSEGTFELFGGQAFYHTCHDTDDGQKEVMQQS